MLQLEEQTRLIRPAVPKHWKYSERLLFASFCLTICFGGTAGTELAKEMKKIEPDMPIVLYLRDSSGTMKYVDGFISKDESSF